MYSPKFVDYLDKKRADAGYQNAHTDKVTNLLEKTDKRNGVRQLKLHFKIMISNISLLNHTLSKVETQLVTGV